MVKLKTVFHKLKQLIDERLPESEREAISLLILGHFGYSSLDIHKDIEANLPEDQLDQILHRVNRQEPIQYILGEAWFYGRSFFVQSGVLIPRPETEILIDQALKFSSNNNHLRVLDLGTGSGCIPVTLAAERPNWDIVATDISLVALEVAQKNATRHNVNISLLHVDMLKESPQGNFNLILSNPPYIPYRDREKLQSHVVEYEPHEALFSPDEDPLIFYKAIARWAKELLLDGGEVLVEIQDKTGRSVCDLFKEAGLIQATIIPDLDSKERFVRAVKAK